MRIAWKLRVAGWLWPGLGRGRQDWTTSASCAVVVNGRADQYVPNPDAERLQRAARAPKEVLWYEGRHDWTSYPEVLPAVMRFLRRELR